MDNTEDFFKNYRGKYSQYWIERWGLIPELPTSFDNANSIYELVSWLQRASKNLLDDFQQLETEFEDFKNAIIDLLEYLIPELIRRYHDSAEFRALFIILLEDILAGEERNWVKDLLKELLEVDMREWIDAYLKELYGLQLQEFFTEVANARGQFDTLYQNLNNIEAKADTANQKANNLDNEKVDKNGASQVTWAMLAQDAREQISGNKTAIVGINSVSTENIVDGSVKDTKLDERMGFGLVLSGRLLIDATNNKVVMEAGTFYQVGKRKNAPTQKVECPYVKNNGVAQYIVYNDERNDLSIYILDNISQISNRDTILAITYADTLIYPQFSRFVETKGLEIGERTHFINGSWGTLIQGKIVHNPTTNELEISKELNDFIVAYKGIYYQVPKVQNIKINTGAGLTVYLNTSTLVIEMLPMLGIKNVDKTSIPNSSNRIKIAEFYLGKLHHISNKENIYQVGESADWKIEQLKVDLQTKRTVIVTLGDSTTDGYMTSNYSGNVLESLSQKPKTYTEILNSIINNQKGYSFNHKFYNRGFSGETISWLKDNLDAVLAPITEKIDYAIIAMGINDSVYGSSNIQGFKDNHINVINRLLSKGIKPILMSTQAQFENYNRFGSKINSIADNIKKELADELGIPFIDYNAGTRNILNQSEYSIKSLIPDMCHFGDLGHQKGAEFLASQLIHQTVSIDKPTKIGYQNNKVVSDLNYSDFLTDEQKDVKWITRTDGFDLEGQLNVSEAKTMFEVSVYIEKQMTVSYFGDNVSVTSNGQTLSNGATLDIGFYRITVKNQLNILSKFRGLKFAL